MSFIELISPQAVIPSLKANSKKQALQDLAVKAEQTLDEVRTEGPERSMNLRPLAALVTMRADQRLLAVEADRGAHRRRPRRTAAAQAASAPANRTTPTAVARPPTIRPAPNDTGRARPATIFSLLSSTPGESASRWPG